MKPKQQLAILNAADAWDLSSTGLRILILIQIGTHTRPSEIAKELNLTCAGAGNSAQALNKRRLIRKRRHKEGNDERGVTYSITPYGKRMLESILSGNPKTFPDTAGSLP